jgi:hypothetical protein
MNNEFDDIIKHDIEIQINSQIHKCFKVYGLEKTLEKIEELYLHMPELKEKWLTEYWKIIRN